MCVTIASALAFVCLAWGCGTAIAFLHSLAVSLEGLPILWRRAVRVSAPAMWITPAALFLSGWSLLGAIVGVVLVANTARLLVSRMLPRAGQHDKRRSIARLFRDWQVRTGVLCGESTPVIVGAFALQGAVIAILQRRPFVAAGLAGITAAVWTLSSIKRRAYDPRVEPGARRTMMSVALTLLITIGVSVPLLQLRAEAAREAAERGAADRASVPETAGAVKISHAVPRVLLSGKELVPGVILVPQVKRPAQPRIRLMGSRLGIATGTQSLNFPFTGEYHLFPTSSGRLQPGSVVYPGTPLDAVYATLGGSPLETHGYQKLNPPMDFSNCARIQMTIVSGERSPSYAVLQLVHEAGVLDLGSDIFALESGPEETLTFPVPQTGRRLLVSAIRAAFYHDPTHREESTRVAIERFTMVPRIR